MNIEIPEEKLKKIKSRKYHQLAITIFLLTIIGISWHIFFIIPKPVIPDLAPEKIERFYDDQEMKKPFFKTLFENPSFQAMETFVLVDFFNIEKAGRNNPFIESEIIEAEIEIEETE